MASFEQNSPLTEFQRIIGLRACEIVHLDLNYSGGVASVARMAAKAGITIVNRSTEAAAALNFGLDI